MKWQRPPCASMRAIFAPLVLRGMTATKSRPSNYAKYASLTAVDPEDASMTVVPSVIHPLQIA